jgi:uncharacterized membrane protein YeaQ/YmgE (transglycosylase-associated protein family)
MVAPTLGARREAPIEPADRVVGLAASPADDRGQSSSSTRLSQPQARSSTMGIIAWIVLGLLAGAIAKALLPGDDPGGVLTTLAIGIVGAVLGGLVADWVGFEGLGSFFDLRTWILAVAGSFVLLLLIRMVAHPRDHHRHTVTG